jgi:hypothetical protein
MNFFLAIIRSGKICYQASGVKRYICSDIVLFNVLKFLMDVDSADSSMY